MYRQFNHKFNREMVSIHPGEYYVSGDDEIIATVLGSCVAVALFDPTRRIGGLNHFMLPGSLDRQQFFMSRSGKYGMYAMELLINALLKSGASRDALRAKVFGGGSVLNVNLGDAATSISRSNIEFALQFLETEGIPVDSSDTGGTHARKILFFPANTRVMLKRLGDRTRIEVEHEEKEYLEKLQADRPKPGSAELL